jgi:hypothetical protein
MLRLLARTAAFEPTFALQFAPIVEVAAGEDAPPHIAAAALTALCVFA